MSDVVLEISKKQQISLIYGYLRENINDYTINMLFSIIKKYIIIPFCWDKNTLLNGMILNENNLIVKHNGKNEWNYIIICNIIFETGIHYFEIKVISRNYSLDDICYGYVPSNYIPKCEDEYQHLGKHGWGYFSYSGNLYNNKSGIEWKDYGIKINIGDIIKCQCNFNDKTIEYYINGKSQGIAYKNLDCSVRPAVSLYGKGNSVKLLNVK